MDLASLDVRAFAAKGAELEFYHPVTRKGLGIFATIIGRDSDEFQTWVFKRAEQKAEEAEATRRVRGGRNPDQMTAATLYEDAIEETGFCMRGWREITDPKTGESKATLTIDGNEVSFNGDNSAVVLKRFPWMLEQTQAGIGNRALFMPASATN